MSMLNVASPERQKEWRFLLLVMFITIVVGIVTTAVFSSTQNMQFPIPSSRYWPIWICTGPLFIIALILPFVVVFRCLVFNRKEDRMPEQVCPSP